MEIRKRYKFLHSNKFDIPYYCTLASLFWHLKLIQKLRWWIFPCEIHWNAHLSDILLVVHLATAGSFPNLESVGYPSVCLWKCKLAWWQSRGPHFIVPPFHWKNRYRVITPFGPLLWLVRQTALALCQLQPVTAVGQKALALAKRCNSTVEANLCQVFFLYL